MNPSPTSLAVGFRDFGSPDVLEVVEVPLLDPRPAEVRVSVRAAAANPTDTLTRSGANRARLEGAEPPFVVGMDIAGVVEAVGEGVDAWQVGDEVAGITVPGKLAGKGGYCQRVVLPAESLTRIPRGSTFVEASTLPMNGLTAVNALDVLDLPPGSTIVVTGGAGAFGGYTIPLARRRGLHVIADGAPADEELLLRLGADIVVERGPGVAQRIVEAAGRRVDGVIDGAVIGDELMDALADGAPFLVVRSLADATSVRGIDVRRVLVVDYARRTDLLDELRALVEDGTLELRVAQTFAPEDAPEIHRRLEAGGVRGRMVIDWSHLA